MARQRSRARAGRRHVHVGRPPAGERDARRAQRREALLDAAIAAIEAGGDEVTMTAMAAEAGVTKPVLYRYFGDRAGLYEAVGVRFATGLLADLRPALEGGPAGREAIERAVGAYLAYVDANRDLYRFLVTRLPAADPEGSALVRGFAHLVATEVAAALGPPLRAAGLPPAEADLVAFAVTGMVQLAGERWLDRPALDGPALDGPGLDRSALERSALDRSALDRSAAVAVLGGLLWSGLTGLAESAAPAAAAVPARASTSGPASRRTGGAARSSTTGGPS